MANEIEQIFVSDNGDIYKLEDKFFTWELRAMITGTELEAIEVMGEYIRKHKDALEVKITRIFTSDTTYGKTIGWLEA